MNKNIYLIFGILLISMIGFTSAENSYLGYFKQGNTISLTQTCDTCTYVILDSVKFPNQTKTYSINMTKSGNTFNYTFTESSLLGSYTYNTCGDKDGNYICEAIDFDITPSGNSGGSNMVFYVLIIIIFYAMTLISFWGRNATLTVLSGMALLGLGIYMVNNGVVIYRDWITLYFSYFTIALGAIVALWAILEELELF